jgi:hypothetical protein
MCLENLSGCELVGLASSLALIICENITEDEANLLSLFFSSLGDNIGMIGASKSNQED